MKFPWRKKEDNPEPILANDDLGAQDPYPQQQTFNRPFMEPFSSQSTTIILSVPFCLTSNTSPATRAIIAGILLAVFWKEYKLKFRIDILAIIIGIIIAVAWLFTYDILPLFSISFEPMSTSTFILKLIGFLIIAPLIEELFTRSFVARVLINKDWRKVKIGKFTVSSFLITAIFFGFSHNAWVAGLISAVLLNILLYKRKSIESCILAHFTANLTLAVYIIANSAWYIW